MKCIYVVIDNGQPYSCHVIDIHKTALSIEEVVELIALWNSVGRFYDDHAKVIAMADELFDVEGHLIDAPSLRAEYNPVGENKYRWDFHFDLDWHKDSKVDRVKVKERIIELIVKERKT